MTTDHAPRDLARQAESDDRGHVLRRGLEPLQVTESLSDLVLQGIDPLGLDQDLLGGVGQGGQLTVEGRHRPRGEGGPGPGRTAHRLVEPEIEEGQEHVLAVGGLGVEELGEAALRLHELADFIVERTF